MKQALLDIESTVKILNDELTAATEIVSGLALTNQLLVNALKIYKIWLWSLTATCAVSIALTVLSLPI